MIEELNKTKEGKLLNSLITSYRILLEKLNVSNKKIRDLELELQEEEFVKKGFKKEQKPTTEGF